MSAPPSSPPPPYKLCPRCRLIYPAATNFCGRDREPLIADARIIAGRYILLHQVGSGTMSEVYAAEQPQLGRKVAIKLLRRDLDVVRRFYSEVRAVGQIRHEHVVTIHDSGRIEDGRPYIAMEYLEGEDLSSHLKKHGPMQSSRAMLLWRQAVSAVAAAHRRHVVHRDIKPANLFLTFRDGDDGPEEIIKVIDFSIAKLADSASGDSRPTEPGAIVGTVLYMAPEQLARSEATPRSDVYSLGLVLMEMLTGKLPWGGAGGDVVKVGHALQRLVSTPSTLRELDPEQPFSEELQQLASDVLSQEPMARPADAGELLRRMKRLPEMRDWQRLPRRLSWSGSGDPDTKPDRERAAVPELLPTNLSELQTRKRQVDADEPPALPTSDNDPLEGPTQAARGSSWSASGSLTEVSVWPEEPTVPAEGALLEQHMRSLEAALFAETRRAQNAGMDFSADSFSPVPRSGAASAGALPPRDDSSSRSKVNVFYADDLNSHLDAVPETMGEEPTIPTSGPRVLVNPQPPPSAVPPPVSAVPALVVVEEFQQTSKIAALVVPLPPPPKRSVMTRLAYGLAAVLLIWSVYYGVAQLRAPVSAGPGLPAMASDLRARDDAAPREVDAGATANLVADLAAPQDLSAVLDGGPADAESGTDNELIRVRLFYNEDDGISQLACAPAEGPPSSSTQHHRVTLRALLRPGAVCTASGPEGTLRYTYEQLVRHHTQRSGEIRFHVQGRSTTTAPPTPTENPLRPSRPGEPSAAPPATEPPSGLMVDRDY